MEWLEIIGMVALVVMVLKFWNNGRGLLER